MPPLPRLCWFMGQNHIQVVFSAGVRHLKKGSKTPLFQTDADCLLCAIGFAD